MPGGVSIFLAWHSEMPTDGARRGLTMSSASDGRPGQVADLAVTLAAHFALLYPPYNGMRCPPGRAEGQRPSAFPNHPQEWGQGG